MSTAQCSALNNALKSQGLTNTQLAARVGLSEQRVGEILVGASRPTAQEFDAFALALGLSKPSSHAKVTA